jgi:hypothetical protein
MVLSATCYTIENMLASLGSDTERLQAATDLVSSVDAAFGSDASEIGEEVRTLAGLPKIVQALAVDDLEFQQMMLVVLGNLSSDAFDPNSSRTKMLLRDTDVVAVLIPLLRSASESLTLYAAACLQNMCHDQELAVRALRLGAHPVLLQLVKDEQPVVQKFAAGALHNISRAVQHLADTAFESGSPRKQLASSQLMGDVQLDLDAEQVRNDPSRLPLTPRYSRTANPSCLSALTHKPLTPSHPHTPITPHPGQAIERRFRQYGRERELEHLAALKLQVPPLRALCMPSTHASAFQPRVTTSLRAQPKPGPNYNLKVATRHLLATRAATTAATATVDTAAPAAHGVAAATTAAVSPAAEVPEVPEVAVEVEAAVLASQYNWLERTAGGVQLLSGDRIVKRAFSSPFKKPGEGGRVFGGNACGGSKAYGSGKAQGGGSGGGAAGKENSGGHKGKVGPLARTGLAVRRAIGGSSAQPQRGTGMVSPARASGPTFEVHRHQRGLFDDAVMRI